MHEAERFLYRFVDLVGFRRGRGAGLPIISSLAILVLLGGAAAGFIAGLACSENIHPGTLRAHVCPVAGNGFGFAVMALLPPSMVLTAGLRKSSSVLYALTGVLVCLEAIAFAFFATIA